MNPGFPMEAVPLALHFIGRLTAIELVVQLSIVSCLHKGRRLKKGKKK